MRLPALVFLFLVIYGIHVSGQTSEADQPNQGELYLRIKNINFIKNNEYFNPISASKFELASSIPGFVDKSQWIEGYTLMGVFFQPELIYRLSSKVTLRGGIHLLKYSGADKFSKIKPVLSTTLNLSDKTAFTIGSLSGSDTHMMFDPHFDTERLYTEYLEDGFQFKHKDDHFFTDTWISWENFIVKNSNEREIFTFGESFRYTSPAIADAFHLEVPVQIQFKHYGGQISNFPEHVETFFNASAGLRLNYDIAGKKYGEVGVEYLRFLNSVLPKREEYTITNGDGSWLRFHYTYKTLYVGAAVWDAHNFFAPNGNQIYASIIDFNSDYVIHDRKVITNSFYLNLFPEKDLEFLIGFESYYNPCLKKMDYTYMLHLNFDKLFKLADIRN